MPVNGQFPAAGRALLGDLAHRAQDRRLGLVRREAVRLVSLGSSMLTERRSASRPRRSMSSGSARGWLGVDVAVEAVFLPQDAQSFDHALMVASGLPSTALDRKRPLYIIAAVEADRELGQLPRVKVARGARLERRLTQ